MCGLLVAHLEETIYFMGDLGALEGQKFSTGTPNGSNLEFLTFRNLIHALELISYGTSRFSYIMFL